MTCYPAAAARVEPEVIIRQAHGGDLEDVAFLLDELGYPLAPEAMKALFLTLIYDPQMRILLASADHKTVGLIFPSGRTGFRLKKSESPCQEGAALL